MADEPEQQDQADQDESVEGLATTTMTKDHLKRALNNQTPGTTQATDYLKRAVLTGNKDYLGRSLVT